MWGCYCVPYKTMIFYLSGRPNIQLLRIATALNECSSLVHRIGMLLLAMKGHFRLVVNRENFYFIDFIHPPDYFSKLYRSVTLSR